MPQVTFPVTRAGLAVPVLIGLEGKTTAALHAAGLPIPTPAPARGLLDTAADVTAVASWVLQQLALPPVTTASTQTVGGIVAVHLYEVSLSILDPGQPAGLMLVQPYLLVSELPTLLSDADVLIGLDVLLECRLLLDGPIRQFTLAY